MGASIGSLTIDLALQSANFVNGLRNAQAQTNAAAKSIQSAFGFMKGAAVGFLGALSVDMLTQQIGQAFDYADAIVDLSNQTGASTKVLQEFRYAAQMSGSSVESADAAIAKFTKNLGSADRGNQAMAKSFRDLGVTAKDPDQALRQFMDGIAKLPTAAQRQSAAMAIMGKSAGDLSPLLGEGSANFDQLAAAARNYGIVIEDGVLRNAGQVNDQLDTMKMIVNAQMANAIIQNADALMQLANGFINAAAAAGNFFAQFRTRSLMSVANGVDMNSDIPTVIGGRLKGKSNDEVSNAARAELKTYKGGREALHADLTRRYNDGIRRGDKGKPYMQAILAEREDIALAEAQARKGLRLTGGGSGGTLTLPGTKPSGGAKKSSAPTVHLRSDAELAEAWQDAQRDSVREQMRANLALMREPKDRAGVERDLLGMDHQDRLTRIDRDTGSDREIREGKKRYTAEQAETLKEQERATEWMRQQNVTNELLADEQRDSLDLALAKNEIEADDLQSQATLARTSRERRDLALKQVENAFARQKIELDGIIASSTATEAEKEIARLKLAELDKLKGRAVDSVKQANRGPLGEYLSSIPKTAEEVNEALERVQVEGLQGLESGILGVIKGTQSLGDTFSSVLDTVLDGILKIIIQQTLIKPLGDLLGGSGGGSSGGGWLGSLFKAGIGAITGAKPGATPPINGARANGGLTRAGDYLMGERGPEIVRIGNTANVVPTRALSSLAANDNRAGPQIHIGNITSNDPAMVKRMVFEGVAQAMPVINEQAKDYTLKKLQRRGIGG